MIDWIIGIVGILAIAGSLIMVARCLDPHDPYGKW